ncbi:MAG: hypothetical protein R2873_12880 [Caldilineaceae bacterium]
MTQPTEDLQDLETPFELDPQAMRNDGVEPYAQPVGESGGAAGERLRRSA